MRLKKVEEESREQEKYLSDKLSEIEDAYIHYLSLCNEYIEAGGDNQDIEEIEDKYL